MGFHLDIAVSLVVLFGVVGLSGRGDRCSWVVGCLDGGNTVSRYKICKRRHNNYHGLLLLDYLSHPER